MSDTRKSVVVDIISDSRKFLEGFEEAIHSIEKAAKKADILGGIQDDIDKLKSKISGISDDIEKISLEPTIDPAAIINIEKTIKGLKSQLESVTENVSSIELYIKPDSVAKTNKEIGIIRQSVEQLEELAKGSKDAISNMFNITHETKIVSDDLKQTEDRLKALLDIQKELTTSKKQTEKTPLKLLTAEFESLSSRYKKIRDDIDSVDEQIAKAGSDPKKQQELNARRDNMNISLGQTAKRLIDVQQKMSAFKSVDKNTLIPLDDLQNDVDIALDNIVFKIENINKRLERAKNNVVDEVTKFEVKNGKVRIPVELDKTAGQLRAMISSITKDIQSTVDPITIPIQLVSAYKTNIQNEINELKEIKIIQDQIDKITEDSDRKIAQSTLDKIKAQFEKELRLDIKTNIKQTEDSVSAGIERIRKALKRAKIGIYPEVSLSQKSKEHLLKQLYKLAQEVEIPIPKEAITIDESGLKEQINNIQQEINNLFNTDGIDSWTKNYLESLDKICEKMESLISKKDMAGLVEYAYTVQDSNILSEKNPNKPKRVKDSKEVEQFYNKLKEIRDQLLNVQSIENQSGKQTPESAWVLQKALQSTLELAKEYGIAGKDMQVTAESTNRQLKKFARSIINDQEEIQNAIENTQEIQDVSNFQSGNQTEVLSGDAKPLVETEQQLDNINEKARKAQDALNSISQASGTMRAIHWVKDEGVDSILNNPDGINTEQYGMIQSFCDQLGDAEASSKAILEYWDKLHAREFGPKGIVIDIPEELARMYDDPAKSPEFIPQEYIRGAIDANDGIVVLNRSEQELLKTQEQLNSQVKQTPLLPDDDNVVKDTEKESKEITSLNKKIGNVIKKINEKTEAFKNEEKVVAKVIPSETEKLGKLVAALEHVKRLLQEISADAKQLDFSNLNNIGQLNKLKSDKINNISTALSALSDGINGLTLKDGNVLNTLQDVLSKSDELKNLASALKATASQINAVQGDSKLYSAQQLLTDKSDSILSSGLNFFDDQGLTVLSTTLKATSKGTIELIALVDDAAGSFKEYTLSTSNGLDFVTTKIDDNTDSVAKQAHTWQKLHNTISSSGNNETAEFLKDDSELWEKISNEAKEYKDELGEIVSIIRSVRQTKDGQVLESFKITGDKGHSVTIGAKLETVAIKQSMYDVQKVNSYIDDTIDKLRKLDASQYTDSFNSQVELIIKKLKEFKSNELVFEGKIDPKLHDDFNELKKQVDSIFDSEKSSKLTNEAGFFNLLGKVRKEMNDNTAMSKRLKKQYQELADEMERIGKSATAEQLKQWGSQFKYLHSELERLNKTGKSFIDSVVSKTRGISASFIAQYLSLQDIFRYIREGYQVISDLDQAYTEMKKVSDESSASLKEFQGASFEIAKNLGTTAVEIQNSAADFMRLGYSLKEASKLAQDANVYANVGDMQIDEATEHMISSIQAWQSEFSSATEASIALIDKYNEVGNNFAITSADIGSAMERSAAALKVAGNTLDESIGLITAGNLIQQDADTTANALKVMSLRIRGSKTDLEEMGEETDNLASSTSKLREEIKALTGVDIMLDDKTYKSTANIIQEIGAVWDKLDNISQANVLERLAGKTRASTVAGLIENYEVIAEVAETAAQSEGSAMRENLEYMESIEGRTAKLITQLQEFWSTFIDTDLVKDGISALTGLLELATNFVDTFGSLGSIGIIGGIFGGIKAKKSGILYKCTESKCF